jgi:hypothetical protein
MFGWSFYFGSIRKYVALFGSLFNDIMIERVDANGDPTEYLKVPLAYGPKDRFLSRLKENPDLLRQVNQVLPRMSFEIKSIEYDADRKLNTIGQNRTSSSNNSISISQFNPVPYNFNINLSILSRNADDAMRIVEQILPFFKPEWTTAVKLIPDMNIEMDIPVVLKSINYEDTYEAAFTERYAIIWELQFVLKGYIYGPTANTGVIKQVITNFRVPSTNTAAQGVGKTKISEYETIIPGLTVNGTPTANHASSIPVSQISANSNYGYITDFYSNIK